MNTPKRVVDTSYGRHHRPSIVTPYLISKDSDNSPAIRRWAQLVMDRKGKRHSVPARHREAA